MQNTSHEDVLEPSLLLQRADDDGRDLRDWRPVVNLVQSMPAETLAAKTGGGATWLHLAAQHLKPAYCALLLARGADVNEEDRHSAYSPLHFVVQDREPSADDEPAGRTHASLEALEEETVRVLLAGGANPNARDAEGETPMMHAARYGRATVIRALLSGREPLDDWPARSPAGDPVVVNDHMCPLRVAVDHGHLEAVRELCRVPTAMAEERSFPGLRYLAREADLLEIEEVLAGCGLEYCEYQQ
jgi:ankyrin repeat protein